MPLGAIFTLLAVVMANLPAVQLAPVPLASGVIGADLVPQ
jgi:hypothetical protein